MCLIVLGWKTHPDYPLILIANRDEFRERATDPLHSWAEGAIYAGKDQQAGGTWLGITAQGRFAAVTNIRRLGESSEPRLSRGLLVKDYLLSRQSPNAYMEHVSSSARQYAGFNLIAGNANQLMYYSNQGQSPRMLTRGIYGLTNTPILPNAKPWPKAEEAKVEFTRLISRRDPDLEGLLDLMQTRQPYPQQLLPNTGLSPEQEQALSAIYVDLPDYGTRSTTLLVWQRNGQVRLLERSYLVSGPQDHEESFMISA